MREPTEKIDEAFFLGKKSHKVSLASSQTYETPLGKKWKKMYINFSKEKSYKFILKFL
tara:strand:+ start:29 stop:202 length:174 start_codon:yes stop_codon:yes gene_type:complete